MNSNAAKNIAASVRARLLKHARQNDEDYQRVLTRFGIERLLFRLSQTAATDHFVLKGAMLFVTWPEQVSRPTGDLDLLGRGDPHPDAIKELFTHICGVHATADGIVFDPRTLKIEPVRQIEEYQGVRVTLKAELARAVISLQVDIGFGDHVYPPPVRRLFPSLLPDLAGAYILMYPPETVVAEKFEAIIRFGETNGRIKDFYDIWIISRTFDFDLSNLIEAVVGTLERRGTAIPIDMPVGLTETFVKLAEQRGLWSGFLRRNPPNLEPSSLASMLSELRRFFGPVLTSLQLPEATGGHWNSSSGFWR